MDDSADLCEAAREWLAKAAIDIRCAEADLSVSPPLVEDVLFHCQQAIEKALKGFLAFHQCDFPKTHHLAQIGGMCEALDPSLGEMVTAVAPLTAYATVFRYPGEEPSPSSEEAEEGVALARCTLHEISVRLPDGAVPADILPTE